MNLPTPAQAHSNFVTLADLLIRTAPSQKAVDFAYRVFEKLEARGAEWMAANAVELQILGHFGSVAEDARTPAPVADNRAYYMAKFQTVLANA